MQNMELIDSSEFAELLKKGLEGRVIFQGVVSISRVEDDIGIFELLEWKGSMSLSRLPDGRTYELRSLDPYEDKMNPKRYVKFKFRQMEGRTEPVSDPSMLMINLGKGLYVKINPDIDTILY